MICQSSKNLRRREKQLYEIPNETSWYTNYQPAYQFIATSRDTDAYTQSTVFFIQVKIEKDPSGQKQFIQKVEYAAKH